MSSILEKTNLNKIYLIYGHLDDMFISANLQIGNFRPFINDYLKSIGYEQIVFYSGAKNVGKFVMDDESARLAINKNKGIMNRTGSERAHKSEGSARCDIDSGQTIPAETIPAETASSSALNKKRRILNPRANAGNSSVRNTGETAAVNVRQEKSTDNSNIAMKSKPEATSSEKRRDKLIYKQPKITPIEFLEDAKRIMADSAHKSAIVFTFFQDFITDRSAPLQPYLELISHLWDEYSINSNENICIFLAPQMTTSDLSEMFDNMENGYVLKNRFFNSDGTANRGTTIEVGLPNADEIGYMLEYLRIVGANGKRISYRQSEKKRIVSLIMYLSRESEKNEKRSGYMNSIYNNVVEYMEYFDTPVVEFDEEAVGIIYSQYKKDSRNPLETLRGTRGWESVAHRIDEIIQDYHMKKAEYEQRLAEKRSGKNPMIKTEKVDIGRNHVRGAANERINSVPETAGYRYPIPHFVLKGNPGVGKTTVARLIGQIFYNEGILLRGTTVEAKRDDLVDVYVGGTAIKTTECVENAQEGVLFIDDAYSLLDKGDEHNYPKEAIDTLVPIMTNPDRYRFCMIMAGYPEPMDELLEMNTGLRSRFSKANILVIEDYKPDLLREIFIDNCHRDGYRFIGENVRENIDNYGSSHDNAGYDNSSHDNDSHDNSSHDNDSHDNSSHDNDSHDSNSLDLDVFFTNLYNQRNRAEFGNARDIVAIAKEVKLKCSLRDDIKRCIIMEDFGDYQKYFVKHGVSSIDEIFDRIDEYVGMEFVKDLFKNIRYEILDAIDSKRRGIKPETYPDHYIFAGNPGTGKTTVGKMIGEFYHMMEVLGGAETRFVDASDVIGSHVGESKNKIEEVMKKAIANNQLLYIDEAYQISESAYGNEIIGAMMTRMTENAEDFKVVFGMYASKVEAFLAMNPGLSRRLRVVEFPDYNPEQLLEIFDRAVKAQGCTITEEARQRVKLILTHKYNVRGEDFGNAGEVKKMLIDMKRLRLERTYSSDSGETDKYEYVLSDIPKNLLELVKEQINPKSFDDIMKELNEQIGMSELKDIVIQKQEEMLFAKKSGDSVDDICPGYYFFVGNPGTGKSTSARMFAEALYRLGIVKTDNFYSCTAKDLIGQYVGETDKKTYALLQRSVNSVLLIDEAYSLSYADSNSDTGFKKEALEQIIAFMDEPEHRKSCCIIFAGYEKDMQGLYRSNSGMRSRIEEVYFHDYTAEETYDIFKLFCTRAGFGISEGVREIYVPVFEELKKLAYFSNGRTARTIYEKTTMKLKRRIVRSDNIPKGEEKLIIIEDLLSEEEAVRVIGAQ